MTVAGQLFPILGSRIRRVEVQSVNRLGQFFAEIPYISWHWLPARIRALWGNSPAAVFDGRGFGLSGGRLGIAPVSVTRRGA